jgi:hypothetical protein
MGYIYIYTVYYIYMWYIYIYVYVIYIYTYIYIHIHTGWWFQSVWTNMKVSWDYCSQYDGLWIKNINIYTYSMQQKHDMLWNIKTY